MKKFIKDYFWDAWFKLPWCRAIQRRYELEARGRFDYKKNADMSIIATNCIGAEIYHILGLQFRTPIVNITMDRNDLVKVAMNPQGFFQNTLEFIGKNKSGEWQAVLTDSNSGEKVTFGFPHEKNKDEINQNFERRKQRINFDNLYFITDDNGLTEESYKKFSEVKCTNKIVFTANDRSSEYPYTYQLKSYGGGYTSGSTKTKPYQGCMLFRLCGIL